MPSVASRHISRTFALLLVVGLQLVLLTAVACGSDADDSPAPTAPPAATEPPAPAAPVAEATREPVSQPTATATPLPATVAQEVVADIPDWPAPDVPNRGYNAVGSEDAPIVLYDYSDFA